ncbi:MAG: SIS domain-containing protein [Oscillospiraceae bacterium]
MDRKDYENNLLLQSRRAQEVLLPVYDKLDYAALTEALPEKELFDAQKIIMTGAGDSYCAGVACAPVFETLCHMEVRAMRAIEVSRLVNSKEFGFSPNTPLVIGVSVSGAVSRVREAMERASFHGANTIAVTGNPDSPVGKAARHRLLVQIPDIGIAYWPGSINYSVSMLALMKLAIRMGRAKNTISQNEAADMDKELADYIKRFQEYLPTIEEKAFNMALKFKDMRCLDFIGDYGDYATAFFGSAKVLEAYGGYTTYDDSEDWCHINYFLRDPETIGRVVIANPETPSFNRILETMNAIKQLESPTMVVSNADASQFPEGFDVFTTPAPKYPWMTPLMQHFVFGLVAGYIAELKGYKNFRIDCPVFQQEAVKDPARIRQSRIEII